MLGSCAICRPVSREAFHATLIPSTAEQVLVTTDKMNYTAKDALQLLKDLNLTQQVRPPPTWQLPSATDPSCVHAEHMRRALRG